MTQPYFSKNTRSSVLAKTNGRCAYCGIELFLGIPEGHQSGQLTEGGRMQNRKKYVIDHVVPISKGGIDETENLLPSCRHCNSSKHANDLEDFRFRLAWMENAGLLFTKEQLAWLRGNGFDVPAHEDDFEFYFETL